MLRLMQIWSFRDLRLWESLFRYLTLSSQLSIPFDRATEEWLRANRDVFSFTSLAPVRRMHDQLKSGVTLSQYLRENNRVFPDSVRNLLGLAPDDSAMPDFLSTATGIMNERIQSMNTFRSALVYPVMILTILFFIASIYRWKVLPTFSSLLAGMGEDLPRSLRFLELVQHYSPFIIAVLIISYVAAAFMWKFFQAPFESLLFRIPFVGERVLLSERVRLLSALLAMNSSQVPKLALLDRIANQLRTQRCKREWLHFVEQLRKGDGWSQSVQDLRFLTPDIQYVLRLLPRVSNEALPLLKTTLDFYRDRDQEFSRLSLRAAEPLVLFVTGLCVALIVYSMYRPLSIFGTLMK